MVMCRMLGVSRSGHYAWEKRPESERSRRNRSLAWQIRVIHERSRRTYGSPRVTAELREEGVRCSRHRVARLMRLFGIRAKAGRKFRVTTDSKHHLPVAPNRLNREFAVSGPNVAWVSDLTYLWTAEGWLYLAAVMDLYSRRLVGWAMSPRADGELTMAALRQALEHRRPPVGLLHHSDQGRQYAAGSYQERLREHGLVGSMSRKGNCWDNAPMESFFGTLKQKLVYPERFATRKEAKARIFEYIEVFYNRQRRHSSLGSLSPAEYERRTDCIN